MLRQHANRTNQVFILDLDGTLIPSAEIDNQCFWQAVFSCYDMDLQAPDLHGFRHVTDSGILREWCHGELGRPASVEETHRIRQVFLKLLEAAHRRQPEHFQPLAGVEDWLETIDNNPHACAGIATGGWGHTAGLKLRLSGLDRFALPLASSDDADARTHIMEIAARRTLGQRTHQGTVYTYIGDGRWDFLASREMGWHFIGIATGKKASRLREAGADDILRDFTLQRSCWTA